MRGRFTPAALLAPAVLFYIALLILPQCTVIVSSLTPSAKFSMTNYVRFFTDPLYLSILWRTLRLSVIVTVVTLVVSYPIAVYLSQVWRRGRTIVMFAVIVPMLVSAVARSYGWIIILGPNGLLSQTLQATHLTSQSSQLLYTELGLVIALTHLFLPFMVLPITGSLQQIDPSIERASRILGADSFRTFLKVVLPLSLPGVSAGSVIVFCLAASSFVTPTLVGGSTIPMMGYLVYRQALQVQDWSFASTVAIVLLLTTVAVAVAYTLISTRRRRGIPA